MFFNPSTVTKPKGFVSLLPKCGACGLLKQCNTPKMPVDGDGRLGMLIVGESPGETEDAKGRPFIGKAGDRLNRELRRHGIDMRRDCWITNAVICHPPKNVTTSKHVEYCRPNLIKTLRELKPKVILVLGGFGIQAVIKHVWKESDVPGIRTWAGWRIPCRDPNAWICPTFHPSYVLRKEDKIEGPAVDKIFGRHIKRAAALAKSKKRPWEGEIPDESKKIEVIMSPKEAAKAIKLGMAFGGLTSFDYETTMLKPDGSDAEIVSCSICFRGKTTIAYPWHGVAIDQTAIYLKSGMPKVGANIKFEDRWTRAKLGFPVNNFVWDSMNMAHVLDHRAGVTSVKFQSFVRFGVPAWDLQVAPYLKASAPDIPNRIRECDLESLLIYNGIDSLVEWDLAITQSSVVGMKLPGA